MSEQGRDFIVSELLSELKAENNRKDDQIRGLHKTIRSIVVAAFLAFLLVIAGFLWYLNQYDFTSTITESVSNTAEGIYAIVDSEGNVISSDLTADEIDKLLEEALTDGESD